MYFKVHVYIHILLQVYMIDNDNTIKNYVIHFWDTKGHALSLKYVVIIEQYLNINCNESAINIPVYYLPSLNNDG